MKAELVALGGMAVIALGCESWAHADQAATADSSASRLEEIIVTAQKQREDLQTVPVSVQVISSEAIAEQNQTSFSDLSRTIPGLHVSSGTNANSLAIRGIGSGSNSTFDQAVATFSDDIYRGRSRMSEATFLDLDRIEILKGPQTTFFGNNAIAGALNLITKKPGDTFEGDVRVLGGMFGQYTLEGAAGGPITDTLGIRVAANADGYERGWITDVVTGDHIPVIHNLAGRITLVYKPTDDLDATLKLEGNRHKTEGTPYDYPVQLRNCTGLPFATAFLSFADACGQAMNLGYPYGVDVNRVANPPGQGSRLANEELALTVNYRQWGQVFTSVTGYSHYDFFTDVDAGFLPEPTLEVQWSEGYHQFSQEFRVASGAPGPIEYLAGVYFQSDRLTYDQQNTYPAYDGFIAGDPADFGALIPYLPVSGLVGLRQSESIYAAFGSLSWNATDRLKLSAGLRGTRVAKDYNAHVLYGTSPDRYGGFVPDPIEQQQIIQSVFGGSLNTSQRLSRTNSALLPSARIQYQINPETMAYARFDRGFLAGGFDGSSIQNFNNIAQFGPEHVNAFEVGLKSKWLNDTLLTNVDVFLSDYSDLQVNSNILITDAAGHTVTAPVVANAAKARSQGVEFEGKWLASSRLTLGTNVTYLHSYYRDYPNGNINTFQQYCSLTPDVLGGAGTPYCNTNYPNGVPLVNNFSGNPTEHAPTWSGSIMAAYDFAVLGNYKFTAEVDPYFTTSQTFVTGDPLFAEGGYVRLDARLTFAPVNGRWSVDVLGKNLTDRTILVDSSDTYTVLKEPIRSVALQLRAKF